MIWKLVGGLKEKSLVYDILDQWEILHSKKSGHDNGVLHFCVLSLPRNLGGAWAKPGWILYTGKNKTSRSALTATEPRKRGKRRLQRGL